jgi:hypothetical protein
VALVGSVVMAVLSVGCLWRSAAPACSSRDTSKTPSSLGAGGLLALLIRYNLGLPQGALLGLHASPGDSPRNALAS